MVRKFLGLRGGGRIGRRMVTLLVASTFVVMLVSGVLAFVWPFSMAIVGLHSLTGFVFSLCVGFHIANNFRPLKTYLRSRVVWVCLSVTAMLSALFYFQPSPVKAILRLSGNLGPALDRFDFSDDELVYDYVPADHYQMKLRIKTGRSYSADSPPQIAIWLENQGGYHIKTLLSPVSEDRNSLPYWAFKVRGWEAAKEEAAIKEPARSNRDDRESTVPEISVQDDSAEDLPEVDGVSSATPNGSFDPNDYILPADPENPMPYKLLFEINQLGDAHESFADQPSLVYSVEIDNAWPTTFQLLDLVGYPQRDDADSKEAWSLYYVGDEFGSALQLIDSALLTIKRTEVR